MKHLLPLVALLLAGSATPDTPESATEDAPGPSCSDCGPLDDPAFYPGEIVVPAREWDDGWGGKQPSWVQGNVTGGVE